MFKWLRSLFDGKMDCPSCDAKGWVSGGELGDGYHVPAMCMDCGSTGRVFANDALKEFRPKIPMTQKDAARLWS